MKYIVEGHKLKMAFGLMKDNPDTNIDTLIRLTVEGVAGRNDTVIGTSIKDTVVVSKPEERSIQQKLFDEEVEERGVKFPEQYEEKKQKRQILNDIKSRQHWTRNEENELIAMKKSRRKNKDVARILQRSEKAVSQKIRQLVKQGRIEKEVQQSRWYTPQEKAQIERCFKKYGSVQDIPKHVIKNIATQMKRNDNAILDQFYILERKGEE